MKNEIALQIAEPCHENWQQMTDTEKGRFCKSCSKEVVDFTPMTDTELLNFFKKPAGNTCGRFSNDQLNRALQPPVQEKKKGWKWLMAGLAALMMMHKGDAQKNGNNKSDSNMGATPKTRGTTTIETIETISVGIVLSTFIEDKVITGKVLDETGHPIPHASIMIDNSKQGVLSNTKGEFSLPLDDPQKAYILVISSVGYTTKRMLVTPQQKSNITVQLNGNTEMLGEIVIVRPKKVSIRGIVTDEKNNPIPAATISVGVQKMAAWSDYAGKFNINTKATTGKLNLLIESPGFENEYATIDIPAKEDEVELQVTMKTKTVVLPEVVVTGYQTIRCIAMMGDVTAVPVKNKQNRADTTTTVSYFENKFIPSHASQPVALVVFPNPAPRSSVVNIVAKDPGSYLVQLFANNGIILKSQTVLRDAKQAGIISFQLPSTIAAGIHYIRLMNMETRNSVTGKLIIQ